MNKKRIFITATILIVLIIGTIVIMTGRYADSFLLSAKANRGEGIRFENIRRLRFADIDNSR